MIEVFMTDIKEEREAAFVKGLIKEKLGYENITFDLEDCDRILRIEAEKVLNEKVIGYLNGLGFNCEVLPD